MMQNRTFFKQSPSHWGVVQPSRSLTSIKHVIKRVFMTTHKTTIDHQTWCIIIIIIIIIIKYYVYTIANVISIIILLILFYNVVLIAI